MASENHIYKMSNAGGFKALVRYPDMLAGNTVWNPWEPQGAYDALATVTVPSGGVTSVSFLGISNTYKHLQLRFISRNNRASILDGIGLRFNSDVTSNYSDHQMRGDGSTASAAADVSASVMLGGLVAGNTAGANIFGANIIDILDYADVNKFKTFRSLGGFDNNGSGQIGLYSANWRSTNPITSITLSSTDGTGLLEYSSFCLYGVK